MMTRKLFALLLAGAMLVSLLAGCGSKDSPGTGGEGGGQHGAITNYPA